MFLVILGYYEVLNTIIELLFNASEKNVQDCIHYPPYTFHRLTIQRLAT